MRLADVRIAIGTALAGLSALGAVACTPTPQMIAPAPPEARGHIHRIGILGPPSSQFNYDTPPAPGAGWGYLRGVGVCFLGMLEGGSHAGDGAILMLAGAIVGCPTIGGLVGAVQNPSEAVAAEASAALERLGAETRGDALRGDLAALLARETPQYTVVLLAPDEPDRAPPEPTVDTTVALDKLQVTLKQCDTGTYILPPLNLYAAVDAQLLRVADRAVLHRAHFEYWGEAYPLIDWGAAGAERFALGVARAQRSLAEQLLQSFFVAQAPTAMTWPRCLNQSWKGIWDW